MEPHNQHSSSSFINIAALLLFAVVIAVASTVTTYFFLSSKSSEQYSTTQSPIIPQPQTNLFPTSSPTQETQTVPDEMANWKVYRNEKYGFALKFPPSWKAKQDFSFEQEGIFIFNELGKESISILPNGEFDRGLPVQKPKISNINFGGLNVQKKEWESIKIIQVLDTLPNWSTKNNRIEILYDSQTNVMNQILSTFKFLK